MPIRTPSRPFTRRIGVVGVAVAVLAVPAIAWAAAGDFDDVPPSHPAYEAINGVADAGIMTGNGSGQFRPGKNVTKATLASTLYRGLGRMSIDPTIGDIPSNPPDPALIAEIPMSIDGFQRGNQGVLLDLTMQVETASPLAADCDVTLIATSWPENLDVGTWTARLYAGTRGTTVGAVFSGSQLAGTAYTYEITADSDCPQAVHVVQGALTGQSFPFQGNGFPFPG